LPVERSDKPVGVMFRLLCSGWGLEFDLSSKDRLCERPAVSTRRRRRVCELHIQRVIRENTPTVFEESVDAVMGEAGKQVPEVRPPQPEDAPVIDPNQPRPPRDPIREIDPQQSRNWIFASALNRSWGLVLKGKDVHDGIEGWQNAYEQMKPYVGPALHFLRMFMSSGGDGGPPMSPTIVT
jgi:hypothetical protein